MDRLIIEQAQDIIQRLDEALDKGQYDRQTGYDIRMAQGQIHDLLGWLKLIEIERDDLDKTVSSLAQKNRLLNYTLKELEERLS